jgi:hypothetical protein
MTPWARLLARGSVRVRARLQRRTGSQTVTTPVTPALQNFVHGDERALSQSTIRRFGESTPSRSLVSSVPRFPAPAQLVDVGERSGVQLFLGCAQVAC